jgi:membrane protein required for colicin V production
MAASAEPVRYAAGFALVFILAVFAGGLVAWGMRKLVAGRGLAAVDRVLGAAFGLVRGSCCCSPAAVVVNMTPLRTAAWWTESGRAGVSTAALKGIEAGVAREVRAVPAGMNSGRLLPSAGCVESSASSAAPPSTS